MGFSGKALVIDYLDLNSAHPPPAINPLVVDRDVELHYRLMVPIEGCAVPPEVAGGVLAFVGYEDAVRGDGQERLIETTDDHLPRPQYPLELKEVDLDA
jgi:hypothetical protein